MILSISHNVFLFPVKDKVLSSPFQQAILHQSSSGFSHREKRGEPQQHYVSTIHHGTNDARPFDHSLSLCTCSPTHPSTQWPRSDFCDLIR